MQNWYCEHEDCGACINEERYQCAGCGGWFCRNCSTVFEATAHQVCRSCLTVWQKLHWLFVQTCCVFCGQTREDTDFLWCRACERRLFGRALREGSWQSVNGKPLTLKKRG